MVLKVTGLAFSLFLAARQRSIASSQFNGICLLILTLDRPEPEQGCLGPQERLSEMAGALQQ